MARPRRASSQRGSWGYLERKVWNCSIARLRVAGFAAALSAARNNPSELLLQAVTHEAKTAAPINKQRLTTTIFGKLRPVTSSGCYSFDAEASEDFDLELFEPLAVDFASDPLPLDSPDPESVELVDSAFADALYPSLR